MLKVFTFGGLGFEQDNTQLTGFMSRKAEALFAYLAYNPQPHPREVLATLFWSDLPNDQALANLRWVVFSLKKQLDTYLRISRQSIALNQESSLWIDAQEFNDTVAAITTYDRRYRLPHRLSTQLEQALALYRGSFLSGINIQNAHGFEEWLTLERERLHLAAVAGLQRFTQDLLDRGLYSKGIDAAQRLLGLDPLDETAQETMMRLLVYDGRTSAALAQFESYRQQLERELDIAPGQGILELNNEIQLGNIKPPIGIRFQHIPIAPTTFVHRPHEMGLITERLDQPDCRLLTLTGVGGVGKTRLALQTAADYATNFAHGVCFIPFVSVTAVDFIIPTILRTLGLGEQEDLYQFLHDKELLLILDNVEHLLDGAELLTKILQTAPRVKLLLTSREPLNVLEEWIIQINEMEYPNEAESDTALEQYTATQLFAQIARRVRADFVFYEHRQTIARICNAVQGLPLALEIAAAWTRTLSCQEIEDQIEQDIAFLNTPMRNVPERHRNVHALFDHSWRMLSEVERAVLMRLAVFQDTFSLNAASIVAGASGNVLTMLSDKALIRLQEERYDMHELVKRYASERLGDLKDQTHSALVDYYLQEAPLWHERGLVDMAMAELLDPELGNLRGALTWLLQTRDLERLLRLCDVMEFFWSERGIRGEGRYWVLQALALCTDDTPKPIRALAFTTAGAQVWGSDLDMAQGYLERAVSLYKEIGDASGQLRPLTFLGHTAMHKGDYARARSCYEELLAQAHNEGNLFSQVNALISLGAAGIAMCDYDAAGRYFDDAFEISVQTGEKSHLGLIWEHRGIIAFYQKNYGHAGECFEKRLEIAQQSGSKYGMLTSYINLGEVAVNLHDFAKARTYFQQALAECKVAEYLYEYVGLLEGFARLAQLERRFALAVTLLAAGHSTRERLSFPQDSAAQATQQDDLNTAREVLGSADYDHSWQHGWELSLEAALDYAARNLENKALDLV